MRAEPCDRMNDPERWDAWITGGVPEALRAHAEGCPTCAEALDTIDTLRAGFDELSRSGEEVDLAPAILRRVDRRWPWAAAVAIAAAAMLALALRPARFELTATPRAHLVANGEARTVEGTLGLALPFFLRTGPDESAAVRGPDLRVVLRPGTEAHFARGEPRASGDGSGRLDRTGTPTSREGEDMKYKSIGAGAAVVLIAVYAGSLTVTTPRGEAEAKAPAGVRVTEGGELSRFALEPAPPRPSSSVPAISSAKTALTRAATAADADPTGARWSEQAQAIVFAVGGEVFDAVSGAPIPAFELHAKIERADFGGATERRLAVSDRADGRFVLDGLGLGRWRVVARAAGYAPVTQSLDLSRVERDPYLVFPMSGGGRVTGRVVDWRERPVAGARVGLEACFGRAAKHCALVETGEDGRFVLEGVPAGEAFAIRAEHERYGVASVRDLRRAEGETEHVEIRLSGILRMFGRVTRGKEAVPVVGLTVLGARTEARAITGAEGRYELFVPLSTRPGVQVEVGDARKVKFAAYPTRRSAQPITWVDADTHVAEAEQDFHLAMGSARLHGLISEADGTPIAGAKILLSNTTGWFKGERGHETYPEETSTDADGRYAIENIPHQAGYRITLEQGDRHLELGYVNVKDEAEVEASFKVGGGRIRGRFVHPKSDASFRPSERSCDRIGARLVGPGSRYAMPRCLGDGRFEIVDLAAGRYVIENRVEWMSSPVRFKSVVIDVAAGEIANATIEVEGEESDTWRLRVLDEGGRFVPGVYVRYEQENTSFTSSLDVDERGISELSLDRRFKRLFVEAPGYESKEVSLADRAVDAVIEVRLARTSR